MRALARAAFAPRETPITRMNLAPADTNGTTDIFVRDRLLGTTEPMSVATIAST